MRLYEQASEEISDFRRMGRRKGQKQDGANAIEEEWR